VEGKAWKAAARLQRIAPLGKDRAWLKELTPLVAGLRGVDGRLDGLWTCRRGTQVLLFNTTAKPVQTAIDGQSSEIAPYSIWEDPPAQSAN
jgi:hypothetical protein